MKICGVFKNTTAGYGGEYNANYFLGWTFAIKKKASR
jgi:hypothetical protein